MGCGPSKENEQKTKAKAGSAAQGNADGGGGGGIVLQNNAGRFSGNEAATASTNAAHRGQGDVSKFHGSTGGEQHQTGVAARHMSHAQYGQKLGAGGSSIGGRSFGSGSVQGAMTSPSVRRNDRQGLHYIAKYSYQARTPEDLSFQMGEHLSILNSAGTWWTAVNQHGQQGYVPSNFVVPYDSMDRHEWYHGAIRRREAENMLRYQAVGTFMIRDSESKPGEYSLSLRDTNMVKHYRIKGNHEGKCHITRHLVFDSISDLVDHYQRSSDGLCYWLAYACPKRAQGIAELDHHTAQNWEVDRENIQLISVLGKGEFGKVFYGKWNGTTEVAVKILKEGSANQDDFLKEATVMKRLQHDKLIRLYAVVTKSEPFMLITEYMDAGSLLKILRTRPPFKDAELIDMASQVAEGMAYLEDNSFIHRDLAARNVLVNLDNVCKVADFGLARMINPQGGRHYNPKEGARFPVKWTAPEAALYNRFSIKSDVWSFGVLLYEMMTGGSNPYPGMSNAQVLEEVSKGHRMSCPEKCPEYVYKVMMDCWKEVAEDRPTFDYLASKLSDMVVNPYNYQETLTAH